eukprot:GEMP01061890.1.p1 GENE.GEMP01061890.1~~GEMP01061890.1.p1  ORF type:complete len:331 (+),score=88.40 GEMP01061890.1:268-1260(+)
MPLKFWRRVVTPASAVKIYVIDGAVKVFTVLAKERSALICKSDGAEYVVAQLQPNCPVQVRLLLFPDENSVELMCRGADIEISGCIEGFAKITGNKTSDLADGQKDSEKVDGGESEKPDVKVAKLGQVETVVAEAKKPEPKAAEPTKAETHVAEAKKQENKADVEPRKAETPVAEVKKSEAKAVQPENPEASKKRLAEVAKEETAGKKARTGEKKIEEKAVSRRVVGAGVQVEVVQVGRGQMAKPGRKVTVHYDGRLASNGKRFDKGKITFRLGMGEVIRGWDEGVKGMLVGEKRKLLIPAPAAYGARGAPPDIPPQATLMFDVELLKVA